MRPLIALVAIGISTPSHLAGASIAPQELQLGALISSGRFGTCHWGRVSGNPCVVKRASATFAEGSEAERASHLENAANYLETEALMNRLLVERALENDETSARTTLAPYVGECIKEGERCLVWHAAGRKTLDEYIRAGQLAELATALGCDETELPRRVLQDVLRALAHVHACGVAHRDVKLSNLLVDGDAHTLRLIDFGSSVDCAGWLSTRRHGLRPERLPCNPLFAAVSRAKQPDFWHRSEWYAFDVYSAALVWLCVVVPSLAEDLDRLGDLRDELRAHRYNLHAWRRACTEPLSGETERSGDKGATENTEEADECAVPATAGFAQTFGWRAHGSTHAFDGEQASHSDGVSEDAWQLLMSMVDLDPQERPSAADALLGRYLNCDCTAGEVPLPAPDPWTLDGLEALVSPMPARRRASADECSLHADEFEDIG